jgi:hypothetical protein
VGGGGIDIFMPYNLTLDNLPAGYALESKPQGGEISAVVIEFTSSEDGDIFVSRLEGGPSAIISKLPPDAGVSPSTIDHLLAIIRRDKTATVYINEIPFIAQIRSKRAKTEKNQLITEDDVADIISLQLGTIEIPSDAGVIFIFSYGWRKGLFFDFEPLVDANVTRKYSLNHTWASLYAYLFQQNLFKITQPEWNTLFEKQWFPFISLRKQTIRRMLDQVRNNWDIDNLLPDIRNEILDDVNDMILRWEQNSLFSSHIDLFKHAIERFKGGDYISATAILYPRIEGVMRTIHSTISRERASQTKLVNSVIGLNKNVTHERSLILPQMFNRFLQEVYFANFDPNSDAVISRNSVAHGVASAKDFSLKSALIGILITDQISFFTP